MILHSNRGITLIELIVFIIVAGMFIPLAYLAYSTALQDTAVPETVVKLRFIAEAKMEDIIRNDYGTQLTLQPAQATFIDVASPHAGYQWKWAYENIAYQDNATHGTTTIINTPPVVSSGTYKVGDYVCPDVTCTNFYRAHFLKWVGNTVYGAGTTDYVVPTSTTYSFPFQTEIGGTSAATENATWSTTALGAPIDDGGVTWQFSGPGSGPPWDDSTSYSFADIVSPTTAPTFQFSCTVAGTSGTGEPSWFTNPGLTVYDGLRWRAFSPSPAITLISVPPSLSGGEININAGGNQIRWIRSDVYRRITVVVRPPGCTTTSCEYSVSTIVTSRTAP